MNNVKQAYEAYKETLNTCSNPNTAIAIAAKECTAPAELDALQSLINADYVTETFKKLRQETQDAVMELEIFKQ